MQRRYVTVDVFTDRAFGGNPLAVVLDAAKLSTAQMQAIATEFNYSETTFVLPPQNSAHDAHVRIFTVNSEIPFAGQTQPAARRDQHSERFHPLRQRGDQCRALINQMFEVVQQQKRSPQRRPSGDVQRTNIEKGRNLIDRFCIRGP